MRKLLPFDNEQSDLGIWSYNFETQVGSWRYKLPQIFDVPTNFDFTTEALINFFSEGYNRDRFKKSFEKSVNTGEFFFVNVETTTAKGNLKLIRAIGYFDMNKGQCRKFFLIIHDITNED